MPIPVRGTGMNYRALMRRAYRRAQAGESSPYARVGGRVGGGTVGRYRDAYAQAREANEQRYKDILAGYQDRIRQVMGMNEQQEADIREDWRGQTSQAMQNLADRGMAGTSIAPTMQAGMKRRETADLRRNETNTLLLRLRAMQDKLRFQERRTDVYPDLNRFTSLMQGAGRYGGGSFTIPARQ